jgi:glycosidase
MNLIDSHDTWRVLTTCQNDKRRVKQMVAFQFAYPGAPMIYYGDEAGLEGDYAESGRRAFPWENIDQELHSFYKGLIACRRQSDALRFGDVESVIIDDARRVYVFVRRSGNEVVYAAFNASDDPVTIEIPLRSGDSGHWRDVLDPNKTVESRGDRLVVQLDPRGTGWYMR